MIVVSCRLSYDELEKILKLLDKYANMYYEVVLEDVEDEVG